MPTAIPALRGQGAAPPKHRWARRSLSDAVARNLFKLMAYKDEYEVARLHTDAGFQTRSWQTCSKKAKSNSSFHLAAPLLAKKNDSVANWSKQKYGPAMLYRVHALAGSAQDTARHRTGCVRTHRRTPHGAPVNCRLPPGTLERGDCPV
jgi:hypothetical protein